MPHPQASLALFREGAGEKARFAVSFAVSFAVTGARLLTPRPARKRDKEQ
jgi:hypothetical protein